MLVADVDLRSRRERKKQATWTALHDAALSLVEERGLAGVTVEDITDRADVALRTFFNYFPSKEDAVIGRDPDFVEGLVAALRGRPADESSFDSIRCVLVESFAARAFERKRLARRIRVVKAEPHLSSRMAAQFEQLDQSLAAELAARRGHLTEGPVPGGDPEPAFLVTVVLAGCRAALMQWCDQGGDAPVEVSINRALDRLATGLARNAGFSPAATAVAPGTPDPTAPAVSRAAPVKGPR